MIYYTDNISLFKVFATTDRSQKHKVSGLLI